MSSVPYMKLWVGDYLSATQMLTTEQHGAYLLLLMAMWNNDGWLPDDPQKLAWICRMSRRRWEEHIAPALSQFFIKAELSVGDVIQNERLSKELQEARKNQSKSRVLQKLSG